MPVLENQRHELFAQELAKGKSASEAYASSGYKPSRKNAARLRANEGVKARLAELQAATARSAAITIESICAELDQANQVAKAKGQAAAMVSASALRAKLGGLMIERVEVGGPDAFADAETPEEIVEATIKELAGEGYRFDEDDTAQFSEMLMRHAEEQREFLASCKAKPITALEGTSAADENWRAFKQRRDELDRQFPRLPHNRRLTNGGG